MSTKFQIQKLNRMLGAHGNVLDNPSRETMILQAIENREAIVSANGALATWTPIESAGRQPKDTYMVRDDETEAIVDWTSSYDVPMTPETFDMLWDDAVATLGQKSKLYVTDRVVGADPAYALPVRVVSYWALAALFTDTMFRAVPDDIEASVFADLHLTLLSVPYDKVDYTRYEGRLRKLPSGRTSDIAVAMDFHRRLCIVYGSAYGGSVKKSIFTVMNYLLPGVGVLPIHCSANEGPEGDCALLLGLSGTGKTTLSADPRRALLGDDEHGWNDNGIANFENGCYAKLIHLRQGKEPEIWNAVFHHDEPQNHGAIVENCMMYPWGVFDVDDDRYTPNSRASYPLRFLSNVKLSAKSGHPKTILFLAADANGVLPPIAKLTPEQAMLWFIMGYTSKLAGTEVGIVDPVPNFNRFFAGPFMPRHPKVYASMLGERMRRHGSNVYLVNTGWSGGPFGVGSRMDIMLTREVINAALSRLLEGVEYEADPLFHFLVPKDCPGAPSDVLHPRNTWADKDAFDTRARRLASEFSAHFDRSYGEANIDPAIAKECPGK